MAGQSAWIYTSVRHLWGCECSYHPKNPGLGTSRSPGRRNPPLWEGTTLCQQPALIPSPRYSHPQVIVPQTGPDGASPAPALQRPHLCLSRSCSSPRHSGEQGPMLNRGNNLVCSTGCAGGSPVCRRSVRPAVWVQLLKVSANNLGQSLPMLCT